MCVCAADDVTSDFHPMPSFTLSSIRQFDFSPRSMFFPSLSLPANEFFSLTKDQEKKTRHNVFNELQREPRAPATASRKRLTLSRISGSRKGGSEYENEKAKGETVKANRKRDPTLEIHFAPANHLFFLWPVCVW